jgi:hypothetical protein
MGWWRKADRVEHEDVVVLGQQVADAQAAEKRHRETHPGLVSPLGDVAYQAVRGEHDLLRFVESENDAVIGGFSQRFEDATGAERRQLRATLTDDDFYTLIAFARRSAVITLRSGEVEHARLGLVALAMIDSARIDSRDIYWAAAIVRHAMIRVDPSAGAAQSVEAAARLAERGTATALRRFREFGADELARDWRMTDVRASGLLGLIQVGDRPNTGTLDLAGAALRLMDAIDQDKYLTAGLTLGDEIPPNWFPRNAGPEIKLILADAPSIAGFEADLRPEHQRAEATPFDHLFLAFLLETATDEDSNRFAELWQAESGRSFATLVVTHARLVMLIISQSSVVGLPNLETDQSLQRFATVTEEILRTTA